MRDTLEPIYRPLMEAESVVLPYCAVCGRGKPLNQHHIVRRGQGSVFRDGRRMERPTVTLCGVGSNLGGNGSPEWCHGKAHHWMLHFRNDRGRLEYLETEEPTEYARALEMGGWEPLETEERWQSC